MPTSSRMKKRMLGVFGGFAGLSGLSLAADADAARSTQTHARPTWASACDAIVRSCEIIFFLPRVIAAYSLTTVIPAKAGIQRLATNDAGRHAFAPATSVSIRTATAS